MKKYHIQLCLLGYQRYMDIIEKLQNYNSKLFVISNCIQIKQMPQTDYDWTYTDDTICDLLTAHKIDNSSVDLCLCFTDLPIEDNYFTRDLSAFDSKTVLCSFYEADQIFSENNVDLFNYIHGIVLNELVQIATLHEVNEEYYLHDDTRNCLFDMCGLKNDIALKYGKPHICANCLSKIESNMIEKEFIPLLQKEFNGFKKPLFYRILDFIKKRPIISIAITFITTIIMNLISSYLFELLTDML